jgi:DNA adenine methylase
VQYLGGKTRIAKQIAAEIDRVRRPGQLVWDAFCGGLSVSVALRANGPVLSTDACAPLIALYQAVQAGWVPPHEVSETTYRAARDLPDSDPMKAFCGFGCSFGGKWFGGYGRGKAHPNGLAGYAARGLAASVQGLTIRQVDFLSVAPRPLDAIIYLDPPYKGTTGYGQAFDHEAFYTLMRRWAEFCPVFVSEYSLPFGTEVWSRASKTKVNGGLSGAAKDAIERLYLVGA